MKECPLYPQKRTLPDDRRMSALCQKQTHALQQFCRYLITPVGMTKPQLAGLKKPPSIDGKEYADKRNAANP